jgi:hypothetical protein
LPLPSEPPPKKDVDSERLSRELSALEYPGYSHLTPAPSVNPALVLLKALSEDNLDARVTQALPWVMARYSDLDWKWLVSHAKLRNVQNRLGFLVWVGRELAAASSSWPCAAERLAEVEQELERSRLVAETTLCQEGMPQAEREWLRSNRPPQARRWNVLASLTPDQLLYAH